jgi:pimeloyl-ACP methyl ester carboxylesterase
MNRLSIGILIVVLAGGLGCAAPRQEIIRTCCLTGREQGVIFAVDGAGGFLSTSKAISQAVAEAHLPLVTVPVEWSHGYGRFIADQIDWTYSRECGCKLAGEIAAYRQAHPQGKVYLIAHSAGSAVCLAAAEALPPDSIERIVLLSPSIASDYDLRPSLRSAREGIDVFCSRRDIWQLGLGVALLGTADGCRGCAAAGRVGFQVPCNSCLPSGTESCPADRTYPEDAALYAKLRQHPWDRCLTWTGNRGGHYGGYRAEFLQAYVLPLLGEPPPQ